MDDPPSACWPLSRSTDFGPTCYHFSLISMQLARIKSKITDAKVKKGVVACCLDSMAGVDAMLKLAPDLTRPQIWWR